FEYELHATLKPPSAARPENMVSVRHIRCCTDQPQVACGRAASHVCRGLSKRRVIKNVERLRTELGGDPLRDLLFLGQRHVHTPKTRAVEQTPWHVSETARGRGNDRRTALRPATECLECWQRSGIRRAKSSVNREVCICVRRLRLGIDS